MKKKTKLYLQENEMDIEMRLLIYLNRYGMFWKTEYAGNFVAKNMRRSNHPFILAGMPDISGVIKGTAVFFEAKTFKNYKRIMANYDKYKSYTGKGRYQKHVCRQIKRINQLRTAGAVAHFVCNEAMCEQLLQKHNLI